MRLIVMLCLMAATWGAWAQKPGSREEWQQVHVRTYPDKTPDEVLDAAERILRAADHDFSFDFPQGKLIGTRPFLIYAVIAATRGTDYWTIETRDVDGATEATLMISRQSGTTMAAPTVNASGMSGATVSSTSSPGQPVHLNGPYLLFWDRMDSLLHGAPWIDCKTRRATVPRRQRYGVDMLCDITTDDNTPDDAPPAAR